MFIACLREWLILPCEDEIVKERIIAITDLLCVSETLRETILAGDFSRQRRRKPLQQKLFVVGYDFGVLDAAVAGDRDQGVGAVERFDLLRKFASVRF